MNNGAPTYGCQVVSPHRLMLRRPNLSLGLGLGRIRNRLGLGWGDVTWGDKAMGRQNLHSTYVNMDVIHRRRRVQGL